MKSNFYEKIISLKDENEKININKMSQLLDKSIDSLIEFRKRKLDELNNPDIKVKIVKKDNENQPPRNILSIDDNSSSRHMRSIRQTYLSHAARLGRIRDFEEENENLNRLIENDNNNNNIEVIG